MTLPLNVHDVICTNKEITGALVFMDILNIADVDSMNAFALLDPKRSLMQTAIEQRLMQMQNRF